VSYVTVTVLESGVDEIRRSPTDEGRVELIVRRPAENQRETVSEAILDCAMGLVGDAWHKRARPARFDNQLTLINSRAALLVAGRADRRELAGDQLFVDFDLSESNLPAGTRLQVGSAVIEVTASPHLGCNKFAERFGQDAKRFVNSAIGRQLRLRGLNARIIVPGIVRVGDLIRKNR
jgi:MOSC domain-containing protein YiiM